MEQPEPDKTARSTAADSEASGAAPGGAESAVRRLGELRDGLLLLAGVLYLLGYASWAFYALEKGMGLVPVLDAQYFAAGIVPAAILGLFALSVKALLRFKQWLTRPVSERFRSIQKTLSYCGFALLLLFGLLSLIFRQSKPSWLSGLPFAFLLLIVLGAFLGRGEEHRFMQLLGLGLIWCYTVLGAIWLILGYQAKVFPHLASELGGPNPRCAQLDLDTSQISAETSRALIGTAAALTNQGVFRSGPVYLIFDGSDYLFLAERPGQVSRTNRVYRLGREAVKGVFPCDSLQNAPGAP